MKLYFEIIKLLFKKYILRQKTGKVVKDFCQKMGITYIKFAQILSTQNYGNLFTEEDRKILSSICDNVNPISYSKIYDILQEEYNNEVDDVFDFIDSKPIGSASISQVHRARLKTGEVVAIKVKRKDITKNINRDINRIRKLVHRYGKLFKFKNLIASDKALEMFLSWIYEETNFLHEIENIKIYQDFADSVNGKIDDVANIVLPKVYEDLCTENIIVMDYIEHKTINQLELSIENKEKISKAINSYFKMYFYALFHDQKIVFHGDPHGGNVYIDENNNIGFLDMGLLFVMSDEEAKMIRQLFLSSYSGNYEKLFEIFAPFGEFSEENRNKFKEEIKTYCENVRNKDITSYFVDMINVSISYQFLPPFYFFKLAKAFMCLNGVNNFIGNTINGRELLQEQTMEYLVSRSFNDCNKLAKDAIKTIPNLFSNILKYGLSSGIAKELKRSEKIGEDLKLAYDNYTEFIKLVRQNINI